ncbi:MAG: hypothetical protein AB1758_33140, partial [Candidatus Eremiobacterota bacterium]
MQELARTPAPPPSTGAWARVKAFFRAPASREEIFRQLYLMQNGDASLALKDLRCLELHLDPEEDLRSALKEYESLMGATGSPERARFAFEAIRLQPGKERKAYRKDLFRLTHELGDLELARRSLNVVRQTKSAAESAKRLESLFRWVESEKSAANAVEMLDAAGNLMVLDLGIEEASAEVDELRKRVQPAMLHRATHTAVRDTREPGSPFSTIRETLDYYLSLYANAQSVPELEAISRIVRADGSEKVHDRAQLVGGILKGLRSVAGAQDELAFLESRLGAANMLTAGKAYANLFSSLSDRTGDVRSAARANLDWAVALKTSKLPSVELSTVLQRLASHLVLGATVESARALVEEELTGGQSIGEKDQWVIIGGVKVRKQKGGIPRAG